MNALMNTLITEQGIPTRILIERINSKYTVKTAVFNGVCLRIRFIDLPDELIIFRKMDTKTDTFIIDDWEVVHDY